MNTKPISFTEMFSSELLDFKIKEIEIPIIQRDYAQGRETKEVARIRKQFLNVLYDALTGVSEGVKLDFVYGSITNGKLIPLDGQQRLTTLFLLHWYIAKHESIAPSDYEFLNYFKYRTRFSSTHFCENLVSCQPDLNSEKLSLWITDQNWFQYTWDKDPTIHSMLVMLDEINLIFKETHDLWKKLTNVGNPGISFYFLPLEKMGLTDSLYIKMNSRGRPLSPFEHFKADFEKTIKEVSIDLYTEFIQKVDNEWVDVFWDYRGDNNIIDEEFMRYFRFVSEMICFKDDIVIVENDFDLSQILYSKENVLAKDNLRFLFDAFDCWKKIENINDFFESIFSQSDYEEDKVVIFSNETNLFSLCCNDYGELIGDRNRKFSLNSTIMLYAIIQYLLNKENISNESFRERIRIIRNLIQNSQDEIREKRMIGLLGDTFAAIVTGEMSFKTMGYNETQKEEEQQKMIWRIDNSELTPSLNKLEDHRLLQGNIAILGLDESEKFKIRVENFCNLFDKSISYSKISNALLAIGDYSQLAGWRFLFGNNNDTTWRELFTFSNQKKYFKNTQTVLLQLLDNINGDYSQWLDTSISDYLSNKDSIMDWRYYFVKYPEMRKGNSGVYWWSRDTAKTKDNPYEIIMMNTSLSLNGKHWDPFLYAVYKNPELQGLVTLEEYGSPLLLLKNSVKILCKNDRFIISGINDEVIEEVLIKQENGIDIEDRIELLKNKIDHLI